MKTRKQPSIATIKWNEHLYRCEIARSKVMKTTPNSLAGLDQRMLKQLKEQRDKLAAKLATICKGIEFLKSREFLESRTSRDICAGGLLRRLKEHQAKKVIEFLETQIKEPNNG